MDGAAYPVVLRIWPQERACLRQFFEYALVGIQVKFVRIYTDSLPLARILVADDELCIAYLIFDCKNCPEMAAAFTALETFKSQEYLPCLLTI